MPMTTPYAFGPDGEQLGKVVCEITMGSPTPSAAAPVASLTDEQIDEAWTFSTGGTIVTEDMRAFARNIAALASTPPAAPTSDAELTAKQIEAGWRKTFSTENPFCPCNLKSFTKAVRWAESARAQDRESGK